MRNYRGWNVTYSPSRPVTGVWRAESFGVTMSAGSQEAIKRMIDQRILDYPGDGHGNTRRTL